MKVINQIIQSIDRRISGKLKYQKFYQKLFEVAIAGMNYGNGGELDTSGEARALQYALNRLEKKSYLIFDVGANRGFYTKMILNNFPQFSKSIHLFEPSKVTFKQLQENLGFSNHTYLNNFALGNQETIKKLYSNDKVSDISSLFERQLDHVNLSMNISEDILIQSLDQYCSKNEIDEIDFLKLDVEGYEFEVLKGSSNMLSRKKINFIQFEFGGCNIDARTYFRDFYNLLREDYNIYRIVKDGIFPVKSYKEELEIFTTINFLAELKTI